LVSLGVGEAGVGWCVGFGFAGLGMVGGGEGDRVGGSGGAGVAVGGGQQFVDRSKVRILLCDGDATSSREVLRLLCNCSYQG